MLLALVRVAATAIVIRHPFADETAESVEMRGVSAIGSNGHRSASFLQRRGKCSFGRTRVTVSPCTIAAAADRHPGFPGVMC